MMQRVRKPSDIPQPMRAELRQHARRTARLARIRAIATDKKDTAVLKRCDALIAREKTRHDAKMAQLEKAMPPAPAQAAANAHEDDEEPAEPEAPEQDEKEEGEP
jgi:hypothetical protein